MDKLKKAFLLQTYIKVSEGLTPLICEKSEALFLCNFSGLVLQSSRADAQQIMHMQQANRFRAIDNEDGGNG
jgi:hypothetical protein